MIWCILDMCDLSIGDQVKRWSERRRAMWSGVGGHPAGARVWGVVEAFDVGFDVEEGGVVEDVDAADGKAVLVDGDEFDEGEADRAGAEGGSGGEEAAGDGVEEGGDEELGGACEVEVVEQVDVGEAVEVFEGGGEVGEEFHGACGVGGAGGLDGHVVEGVEGGVDDADGFEGDGLGFHGCIIAGGAGDARG